MELISNAIFYILSFLSVYVQVFFLITFIENRKKIANRTGKVKLQKYETVTIMVPCWNEEATIYKTVRSLLNLNYPKEKLQIFLIDDGSTDGTLNIIKKFGKYSNVKIFHKENGGKHTALNLGLLHTETEFLGCLDADSYADPDALTRVMSYFEKDESNMAVAPSIVVNSASGFIQNAQKVEYHLSVYLKKMLGLMGAIHVTPGPLTIFRKKVFDDLGPYHHAHNTEDMEIAYRMQKNHYKIQQCHDAYVYTSTPNTVKNLFRQRLRWIYGFINNTIDYRGILFREKYGNFSIFTVPAGILSILAVSFLFARTVFNLIEFLASKILQFNVVGFHFTPPAYSFDFFFLNTQAIFFVTIFVYLLVLLSITLGHRMTEGKWGFSSNIIYFFVVFGIISPFWLMKAIYNTVLSRKPAWR